MRRTKGFVDTHADQITVVIHAFLVETVLTSRFIRQRSTLRGFPSTVEQFIAKVASARNSFSESHDIFLDFLTGYVVQESIIFFVVTVDWCRILFLLILMDEGFSVRSLQI